MPDKARRAERLDEALFEWAGAQPLRRDVAHTVLALTRAALELRHRLERAPLVHGLDEVVATNASGDECKVFDLEAHALFVGALASAPVSAVASEEADTAVKLEGGGRLAVALDPLDGSGNTALNGPSGTIFSIRPSDPGSPETSFLGPGTDQLAAGFVLYGPATMLALSVGAGTDLFALDPDHETFVRTNQGVRVPLGTSVYAVNASNARHWSLSFTAYVADLQQGADGLRGRDFNMRWHGALVMETHRILQQGGVYLYPADSRPGCRSGRLRLVYEAQPVAFLVEQAGGAATDGLERILDKAADDLHERTPLIFGSSDKVERVEWYLQRTASTATERQPLFRARGLFRE